MHTKNMKICFQSLGKRLKYSGCIWPEGVTTLDQGKFPPIALKELPLFYVRFFSDLRQFWYIIFHISLKSRKYTFEGGKYIDFVM